MPLVQTGGKEKTDTPRLPRSSPHFLGQPFSFESRFPPIPGPSFPFRPAIFFPGLLSSSPACCPLPWPAVLFSDPLSSSPARCLLPRPAVFFPGPLSSSPARRPLRRPADAPSARSFFGYPPRKRRAPAQRRRMSTGKESWCRCLERSTSPPLTLCHLRKRRAKEKGIPRKKSQVRHQGIGGC